MNWKRYLTAIAVAIVVALVSDVAINAVLMRQVFVDSAHLWLPPDELNRRVPLGFAALAGSMALLGLLFVRLGGRGLAAGVEFGVWLALAACAGMVGLFSLVPWPPSLVASMAAQQALNDVILGLSLGWIYRDTPARA